MADAQKRVLDFTNVRDSTGINPKRMPEGDYVFTIIGVTEETSKEGNDYWQYLVRLKNFPSAIYPYRCVLTPESLWTLKDIFAAVGIEIPKKRVNVDPKKILDRDIGGTLENDEYEGREKSVVRRVFPAADVVDEPSGDIPGRSDRQRAAASGSKTAPRRRAAEPEEPADEVIDDSELDELDLDSL